MSGTHLEGLDGTNPLGFLAALGLSVAFHHEGRTLRLWWSEGVTPHAIVDEGLGLDEIAEVALKCFAAWKASAAVNPRRSDGSPMPKGDELKLQSGDIRAYLEHAMASRPGSALAAALVAEGSLDKQGGAAKPSDLYFAAGQMKFLDMARKVLAGASRDDVQRGLQGPWPYDSTLPSLGWDVVDDRIYALRASNPSPEKKLTNPGPEALALLGLSLHPVFAGQGRTLTQGFAGTWKAGRYCWPLWRHPAGHFGVRSLLAHAGDGRMGSRRRDWYRSWGVFAILGSAVQRSDQGGYGTFRPPEYVWRDV